MHMVNAAVLEGWTVLPDDVIASVVGLVFAVPRGMRVYVSSSDAPINGQIQAYAEFRIFAALARYPEVRGAHVVLHTDEPGGAVQCSVTIEDAAECRRTSAKGLQAVAAIDRAAERVKQLMRANASRHAHHAVDRDRPAGGP